MVQRSEKPMIPQLVRVIQPPVLATVSRGVNSRDMSREFTRREIGLRRAGTSRRFGKTFLGNGFGAWRRLVQVEPYLAQARSKWMRGHHLYLDLFAVKPILQ